MILDGVDGPATVAGKPRASGDDPLLLGVLGAVAE